MVLIVVTGWLDRQERQAVSYLMEENRVLRRQLRGHRLQLTDDDRRQLAVRGHRLGRQVLRQIANVVTPDTILRWHRQLILRKWTYANKRSGRHSVLAEIRRLVVRMAEENHLGLYTDPRRSEECRTSCRPLDDCPDSQEARLTAGAGAPNVVADISPSALGRNSRGRFLYHGSLDLARISDVLHRVCD